MTKWQAYLPHVNKMPELVQTAAQMAVMAVPPVFIKVSMAAPSGRKIYRAGTMRATENWPACRPPSYPVPRRNRRGDPGTEGGQEAGYAAGRRCLAFRRQSGDHGAGRGMAMPRSRLP